MLGMDVRAVGSVHGRWAIVAQECSENCGSPFLLLSRDARTWLVRPIADGTTVTIGRDRLLAVDWSAVDAEGAGRVLTSRDGRRWATLGRIPDAGWDAHLLDTPSGLVLVGTAGPTAPLRVWRTVDGATWTEAFTDADPWVVEAAVADGDRVAVVGERMIDTERETFVDAALLSADGITWAVSDGWFLPVGSRARTVAIAGDIVVALGSAHSFPSPAGWRTTFAE